VRFGSTRDSAYASVCQCTLYRSKMSACYSYSLHGGIAMLRLFCCVFAFEFLFNPQFDLEPDYIIRKSILHRIERYNLRREILSTFHTLVNNRSIRHFCIVLTPKLPLPLRQSPPKSNTPIPSPTPLTTQTASRSNHPCRHCLHLRTDRWLGRMFCTNSASLYRATR